MASKTQSDNGIVENKKGNPVAEMLLLIAYLTILLFIWWVDGPRNMIPQVDTEKEYTNGLQLLFSRDNWFTQGDEALMIFPATLFNTFKITTWILLLLFVIGITVSMNDLLKNK
ncbi:hypothetical protein [Bacillus mycoides]|uniref:hypothetical protein n=1 Tax=Bacillus mycoides TaxID=1405 RepID=UPI0010BE526C|nr:hypothetical protein [Bacillus mycoides]TKI45565.1 hypothetical protein FC700_10475 [Bacillus mycoides]